MEGTLSKEEKAYLTDIYTNTQHAAAFSSPRQLYRYVKKDGKFQLSMKAINKWLQSQEVYTTNRKITRKIRRRRVVAPYIDYMWDLDTASFQKLSKYNNGYGYFILAIDIMSRYVWTRPIKTTSGVEVSRALTEIFKQNRHPQKIRTDQGTEYSNQTVKSLLKSHGVHHFVTQNEVKANFAERGILSVKSKLMRYMRSNQTYKWVNVLADVTNGYNNSYHRSIRKAPAAFNKRDEFRMWQELVNSSSQLPKGRVRYKFKIGDVVRISRLRHSFHRYYSEHWTNEFFVISGRSMKQYIPAYSLTDYAGENITGIFYEAELQKIVVAEDTVYNIEKIVKRRKTNNVKQVLVKWWGWPSKFNSWIAEADMKKFG